MTDTIFALATAPGRAAVAVVRISGPGTAVALRALGATRLIPRRASLRSLRDRGGTALDQALILWFPPPGSYTGEASAELHLHGGPAIIDAVMAALDDLGLRRAGAGEFTRRAFENGRLDLGQAEAVADLIDAESTAQARQALGQLRGALGERYRLWRGRLVEILAQLEAGVDFPDEDLPGELAERARARLEALITDLDLALADGARGRRIRDGYRVAIVGAPNAGKSTLLNALVERDAAIVTSAPGTTRDVIEVPLMISGYKVTLADMAGLRQADDPIEAEGVRRARRWAKTADLRLWVIDGASNDDGWRQGSDLIGPGDLCVLNKVDLARSPEGEIACGAVAERGLPILPVSLVSSGAALVWAALGRRVASDLAGGDFPATTRARHAQLLGRARDSLARALGNLDGPELAAEDVRLAGRALAMVTGAIGPEDVLDEVFASFCIGK